MWRLIEGDCIEGLKGLADRSVDHVITDPPYEAEAHTKQRRIKRYSGGGAYALSGFGEATLEFDPIDESLRRTVSIEIARIVRRWVLVFCQVEAVSTWRDTLEAEGLSYKRACVWIKPDGQPQLTGDRPGMGYETIVTAHRKGKSRWNVGGKLGIYSAVRHQDHGPRFKRHPTTKPLPLMEALIRDFTDPGELVVDPFAGSGTTGVACVRLGRDFIGFERDSKYAELARRRLSEAREQPDLLDADRFARAAKGKRVQTTLDLTLPETFTPAFLAEGDDDAEG